MILVIALNINGQKHQPINRHIQPASHFQQLKFLHSQNIESDGEHVTSTLQTFDSSIFFRANATDMKYQKEHQTDRTKCVESPGFELSNLMWTIRLCRRHVITSNDADDVDISLVLVYNENTAAWSCDAQMNITLHSKDGKKSISRKMEWNNFNRSVPSSTIRNITIMRDLYNNYMENDLVTIAIWISTKPPNRSDSIALDEVSKTFLVRVKNINKLSKQYSNGIRVRGIKWSILTTKINDHFAIYASANADDMDVNRVWNVSATFQLISFDKNNIFSRNFTSIPFNWMKTVWGFNEFLKWNDLMDPNNKYVENNAALVRIELNVGNAKKL